MQNNNISENKMVRFIKRKQALMGIFSIGSLKDLEEKLSDRSEREKLMSRLSPKDQVLVKKYYLENCYRGKDGFPTCVKVVIMFKHGVMTLQKHDYLTSVKAEFDRTKGTVSYACKSKEGTILKLPILLNNEFEEEFFRTAENSRYAIDWEDHYRYEAANIEGTYRLDDDLVSIECVFMDGLVCKLKGNAPGYHPYDTLYEMGRAFFVENARKRCKDLWIY